jgi:hypothetical protein
VEIATKHFKISETPCIARRRPESGKTNLNGQVTGIHGLETNFSFVWNAFQKYSNPVKDKIRMNG